MAPEPILWPEEAGRRLFLSFHNLYSSIYTDHSTNNRGKRLETALNRSSLSGKPHHWRRDIHFLARQRLFTPREWDLALPGPLCQFVTVVVVVVQAEGRGIRCPRRRPMTRQRPPPLQALASLQGSSQPPSLTVSIYPSALQAGICPLQEPEHIIQAFRGYRFALHRNATMHCVHAKRHRQSANISLIDLAYERAC